MLPIFDLHCHPSIKIYLCNRKIRERHNPLPDVFPSGMCVDLPGMRDAGVQVIACSHYVPEIGLLKLKKSRKLVRLLKLAGLKLLQKFEDETIEDDAFIKSLESIRLLNEQIDKVEIEFNVTVSKNLTQFNEAFQQGKRIILHSLEGGHHLGKSLTEQNFEERLGRFRQEGVCILTIAHFFPNRICDSGGGIPPSTAHLIGYKKPPAINGGLSNTGELVVNWCLENGVIIDLVHATKETRDEVYRIIRRRQESGLKIRPVIFSHTGVREKAEKNMPVEDDKFILPDKLELQEIAKVNGVVGLILMNYWLVGIEEDNPFREDGGIKYLIETVAFIHKTLGSFENISIGTDLDGFTQVPDDVTHVRLMGRVRDEIKKQFGPEAAAKICYENALRVLRAGWS
jgi:microsomal dipeptidase-like Zn-dependent dipeptidase